jgi:hypothetical protein
MNCTALHCIAPALHCTAPAPAYVPALHCTCTCTCICTCTTLQLLLHLHLKMYLHCTAPTPAPAHRLIRTPGLEVLDRSQTIGIGSVLGEFITRADGWVRLHVKVVAIDSLFKVEG